MKGKLDILITASSLQHLIRILINMKEGTIPSSDATEKAVESSIKELATAILESL